MYSRASQMFSLYNRWTFSVIQSDRPVHAVRMIWKPTLLRAYWTESSQFICASHSTNATWRLCLHRHNAIAPRVCLYIHIYGFFVTYSPALQTLRVILCRCTVNTTLWYRFGCETMTYSFCRLNHRWVALTAWLAALLVDDIPNKYIHCILVQLAVETRSL